MYFCYKIKPFFFFLNFQSTPGKPMDPLQSLHVRKYVPKFDIFSVEKVHLHKKLIFLFEKRP